MMMAEDRWTAPLPEQGCWNGFCIATICDQVHHVDATGYTWTQHRVAATAKDLRGNVQYPMNRAHR